MKIVDARMPLHERARVPLTACPSGATGRLARQCRAGTRTCLYDRRCWIPTHSKDLALVARHDPTDHLRRSFPADTASAV